MLSGKAARRVRRGCHLPCVFVLKGRRKSNIAGMAAMPLRTLSPHQKLGPNAVTARGHERAHRHPAESMPSTQPSSRLAARLGPLPQGVLANLAAQLCSDSPALEAAAEECMAAHTPLPHEMVERVLLSPDLVPHILGPLVAEDGAAAAVCSLWLDGWKATNEPRRRLKQVPFDFPEELVTTYGLQMAGTPDGRLVVRDSIREVHILDRSMRVLQKVAGEYYGFIAASDDSVFHTASDDSLHRSSHDGTDEAGYELEGHYLGCLVLAPGGLLFCVIYAWDDVDNDGNQDEIVALDAQTLQLRHRFGLGLLKHADQMAVGGDELYVCDTGNHRLQVFSLTGEHRRSIVGEWREPQYLCFAKDRLYLLERYVYGREEEEEDDDRDSTTPVQGRRVLVLSLQGDILQVVTHPTEPTAVFHSICCFDRKLLASYYTESYYTESADTRSKRYGMLALQGL